MCEVCNPLGLKQPATSQVHGTVFVAVLLAVVLLAVAGRVALSGIGPFSASVVEVQPSTRGLLVTLEVRNDGTRAGNANCQLMVASRRGVGNRAVVLTPRVEPGTSIRFTATTDELGVEPVPLDITCQDP